MIFLNVMNRDARAYSAAPAASTGGACLQGWGCGLGHVTSSFKSLVSMVLVLWPVSSFAQQNDEPVVVPSGQHVTLKEIVHDTDPGTLWMRFRFLAPQISPETEAEHVTYDLAALDMDHLCEIFALPFLARNSLVADRIVISLSASRVPFGTSAPDVTQFFEFYRPEDGLCILEEY